MKRTGERIGTGVLCLIAGLLPLIGGSLGLIPTLIPGFLPILVTTHWRLRYWLSNLSLVSIGSPFFTPLLFIGMHPGLPMTLGEEILRFTLVVLWLVAALASVVCGSCLLKWRTWRLALAGSVAAFFAAPVLGIPALILIARLRKGVT